MATVTVIATTTNASGSGTAALGSTVNRFAIEVIQSNPGDAYLDLNFQVSLDGVTFVRAEPETDLGNDNVYIFNVPASNVAVAFSGNGNGNAITVIADPLTD